MDSGTLFSDLINKYSQLTPWVQALIGLSVCSTIVGIAYLLKETVAVLMRPFHPRRREKGEK